MSDLACPPASDSNRPPAVVLLSGGLDSATVLALAIEAGYACHAMSFRYGQRHEIELAFARRLAESFGVTRHIVVEIDLRQFGGSALTAELPVPKHDDVADIATDIPLTYVPARNTVFLSYALAWAETLGTGEIFVGVNALDYSGYPDCRPEYLDAFSRMANLATKGAVTGTLPVTIHAPLLHWTKAEIIRRGLQLGVDYAMTTSCYDPGHAGAPCQRCDSCLLRMKGFAENGLTDPAIGREMSF